MNFLTRLNKVQELIQFIVDDKKARDVVKTIYWQDTFPFTYDVWKSVDVNSDFPNLGHDVNDFKLGTIVAVEFQIVLHNFKASKKVEAVIVYSFQLLGVYLINNKVQSIMSIPDKRQRGDNK